MAYRYDKVVVVHGTDTTHHQHRHGERGQSVRRANQSSIMHCTGSATSVLVVRPHRHSGRMFFGRSTCRRWGPAASASLPACSLACTAPRPPARGRPRTALAASHVARTTRRRRRCQPGSPGNKEPPTARPQVPRPPARLPHGGTACASTSSSANGQWRRAASHGRRPPLDRTTHRLERSASP